MAHALQIRRNDPCFFKVPAQMRRENDRAFDPWMFSFGPYHAGAACLRDGEHFKHLIAKYLIDQNGLRSLADRIRNCDTQLRDLYIQMPEPVHDVGDVDHRAMLANLLALDSMLIISSIMPEDPPLPFFIREMVLQDALLLENQVPLFVLKLALESLADVRGGDNPLRTLLENLWVHGNPFDSFERASEVNLEEAAPLLGYVYDCLTQADDRPATETCDDDAVDNDKKCMLSTASRLARCGLRFRPCNSYFRGVKFSQRTLELCLPRIIVGDSTLRFLHNLLAYEATSREQPCPVVSYFHIMNCLLSTEEDVQILVDAGVIENLLGSHHELASSWSRLGTGVSFAPTTADRETIRRVERLMKKRWRKWMVAWREKYCEKQPWLSISVVAATILLLLTLLQTIYTIKGSRSSTVFDPKP